LQSPFARLLFALTLLQLLAGVADAQWWLATKGKEISNYPTFEKTLKETDKDKLIIIDFYMQNCTWCQRFQADWNRVVTDFEDWFGDKVVFIKVDGPNTWQVAQFCEVQSYPTFFMFKPNSNGKGSMYRQNRTYDLFKDWVLEGASQAGLKPLEGKVIPSSDDMSRLEMLGSNLS